MAKMLPVFSPPLLLLVSAVIFQLSAVTSAIGINYGTVGNLPPPQQVVEFIKTKTTIDAVKIFDANPDILRALAGSGIDVTIMVPNDRIPAMVQVENARQWVAANVLPFHQQVKIKYICVGNEILMTKDNNFISNLVPAMQSLYEALKASGLTDMKVTTPHAFTVGYNNDAPSESKFNDDQKDFFAKILEFNRQAKSPFMISAYPFFMTDASNVNYATFGSSHAIMDANTHHTYTNMFDAVMDATYSAMNALGYGDVDIAVGETGWPSVCEAAWCTPQNAANYNLNIIKRAQNIGTPLMPNRHIDIFIFALFNEDGKPGIREQNWGLFKPDFTPVYDVGVLRGGDGNGTIRPPSDSGNWCVAKEEATNAQLQANIDWVCSQAGMDCKQISPGGVCFDNNNMKSRASFIMNVYYQSKGLSEEACNFSGSGTVTTTNPSTSSCAHQEGGGTSGTRPPRRNWCVAKEEATNAQLQANIDWVCSQAGIDCNQISPGGVCYDSNNMKSRASFIMNVYYQSKGGSEEACDFSGSGTVTTINPSSGTCVVPNGLGGSYVGSSSGTGTRGTSGTRSTRRKACVAKEEATDAQLQANIDFVCRQAGLECTHISPGGICYDNNNMKTRASFVMNDYYQSKGCSEEACDFSGSGTVTSIDPSRDANSGTCVTTINPYSSTCAVQDGSYVGSSSSVNAPRRSNLVTKWCVAKPETSGTQLQANIDWVCNTQGIDCKAIFLGRDGYCANEALKTRATFVMSAYFLSNGLDPSACEFNGSGIVSTTNPSTYSCFISGIPGML